MADTDFKPTDKDGNPLEVTEFYYVQARDFSGAIASQGRVPADRLHRAKKLYMSEGWDVTITPLQPGQTKPGE